MHDRPEPLHIKKPKWLKTKIPTGKTYFEIKRDLRSRKLFTVCEEAKCPNIGECWNYRTATFMVLGDTCTRACRFCNIKTGNPNGWLDPNEPENVAQSAKGMNLSYVVITMVDRDDLGDGGAEHLTRVISKTKELSPEIIVEVLTGDFQENESALKRLADSKLEVFAHNLETVRRLSPRVRDARAAYDKSLRVLKRYKEICDYDVLTKSALMLGLGETEDEIKTTLADMREHGVDIVTIGQYMRPTKKHLSIKEFVTPEKFKEYEDYALSLGFHAAVSAPLVRSSYLAGEVYKKTMAQKAQS